MQLPHSSKTRVLHKTCGWLEQNREFWFVTVIKTWGASPLPAGSWLAFEQNDGIIGAVSGGCIEADIEQKIATGQYSGHGPWLLQYGGADAERLGLPCGGEVEVLLEHHSPDNRQDWQNSLQDFKELLECLIQRQPATRKIEIGSVLKPREAELTEMFSIREEVLFHSIRVDWQLLLIGASEISRNVAIMAGLLDLPCFVWEPRGSYAKSWSTEWARLEQMPIDKLIHQRFADRQSAILALAHDPKLDDLALIEALETDCGYIGALGSKNTQRKRFQRLKRYAVEDANLNRIHAPIGLDIGSKTPAEIAVSVMAELIGVMRLPS